MDKGPTFITSFNGRVLAQPSGKAYTMMGSFVRWLIDTQGMSRFKASMVKSTAAFGPVFCLDYGVGGISKVGP